MRRRCAGNAEVWADDGRLEVRGYFGVFYKSQTRLEAS